MPTPTPEADPLTAAMRRLARGDADAMAGLYDAASARVYGLAMRILRAADAADEVCLDVFHRAWQQARTFDSSRGSVLTWLLTMTRSCAIDRMRTRDAARAREQALTEEAILAPDPRPQPDVQALLADRGLVIQNALGLLTAEQREVIELAFFDGMSHGRIAKHLNQPLGTIKTRIRSGVRKLAEFLTPMHDEAKPGEATPGRVTPHEDADRMGNDVEGAR